MQIRSSSAPRRHLLTLGAALAMGFAALTPAQAATVDPAKSEIAFVFKQMGVPVQGRFRHFTAQIDFDPAKPEAGKVAFSIDLGSATLGVPETDAELPKAEWFNVGKFPKATFQSTAIKAAGPQRYDVSGTLSIKGQRQNVVVPVTLTPAGATSTATGAFTIKRLDFKIGEGEWADTSMVANDVQVKFKLLMGGLPAAR
jgi:polyisoprenoid-binding protein YceI